MVTLAALGVLVYQGDREPDSKDGLVRMLQVERDIMDLLDL